MSKVLKFLFFVVMFTAISVACLSCGDDEPTPSQNENNPSNNPGSSDNPGGSQGGGQIEQIPGNEILGTWYYLNPNKALKVTITFTAEESNNFSIFGERKCYISIESEFPYDHKDYDNVWKYDKNKWEITRLDIIPGSSGASISHVFGNEIWVDLKFLCGTQRLKFTRNDPGSAVKPSGLTLASDGVFGKYLWRSTIGSHNISFQFLSAEYIRETSDVSVMVTDHKGNISWIKEHEGEAGYRKGYFHFENGILTSVLNCSTVVVIKVTEKKLMIYNPFEPDVKYYLTRS